MSFKNNEWNDILNKIEAYLKLDNSINNLTNLISKNTWKETKISFDINKNKLMEQLNDFLKLAEQLKKQIKIDLIKAKKIK